MDTNEKKSTNEKPVSLAPLDFKQALSGLLKIKPKPKEKPKEVQKQEKPGN